MSNMRMLLKFAAIALLGWPLPAIARCAPPPPASPLPPGPVLQRVGMPANLVPDDLFDRDRANLLRSLDYSLQFIELPSAQRRYPMAGIERERVARSLRRFRELVLTAPNARSLTTAVQQEFDFYRSVGRNGQGEVLFTGYYEAVYPASRVRTAEYRYPLYRLPADFAQWRRPHPPRRMLETGRPLAGEELVWLRDRFQAFLIHIQGSARLQLTDGTEMTVGYAGKTDRPYTSIGRELGCDGKIPQQGITLQTLIDYFRQNPPDLNEYLPRNESFVFFRETHGQPPTGSLGFPVVPERAIATDRSLMPAGGLTLFQTQLPFRTPQGTFVQRPVTRFALDLDTGGAIRSPGRVDIFMGTGEEAKARAGEIATVGNLYYLLLKEDAEDTRQTVLPF